ncbi:MAG: YbaB/EbfC family nucleoid-associated protein [Lentisphaeria bacterium]|jgi:hypothetical protein
MNIMKLMKQAQKVQGDVARVQEEVAKLEKSYSVGGGAVTAVAKGDGLLKSLTVSPELLNKDDAEALQEMLVAAANGALQEVKQVANQRLQEVTAGLQIPGLL